MNKNIFWLRFVTAWVLACFLNQTLPPALWAGPSDTTAVFLAAYSNTLSSSDLRKTSGIVYRALKNSTHFQFYDQKEIEGRLNTPTSPEAFLARMDESIAQARAFYFDFKFEKATSTLKNIIAQSSSLDVTDPLRSKISEAYLNLGLVFDAQLRSKESWAAYINSAALDPLKQLDPARYPPNVISKFSKAKNEYAQIKEGSLTVETTPPGAQVFLDDKEVGLTPVFLQDLSLGVHPLQLRKDRYAKFERNVVVALRSGGDQPQTLKVDFGRKSKAVSLASLADDLSKQKSYDLQIYEMALLGNRIGVDQIFSARIEKGENEYELSIVQVDSNIVGQAGRASVKASDISDLERKIPSALSDMLGGKTPDRGTDLIAVGDAKTDFKKGYSGEKKSFFKSWPFYLVLGVVVIGGGAGAAFALRGGGGGGSSAPVTVSSPPP